MSFRSKDVIYKNIVMEETVENDFDETVMDGEYEVDENIHLIKEEVTDNLNLPEINSSYEDRTEDENEDFGKNSHSMFVGIKQEWSKECEDPSKSMENESMDSEDERTEFYLEKGSDVEEGEDEEETIAMFVTASGQQLALYAVEDSDDYFAVAVYDESGEPPTNFQFLMKSDVERLIREGAVRTVKKPTQIKKQLVSTQPPVFKPKEEITGDLITRVEGQLESINCRNAASSNTKVVSSNVKPAHESPPAPKIVSLGDSGSDEELIEQSTVQYILCDGDQSDTELTFDEIQATLQEMKPTARKPSINDTTVKNSPPERKKANNGLVYITSPPIRNTSYRGAFYPSKVVKVDCQTPSRQSSTKKSHISNTSIIGSKQIHAIKQELSPISDPFTPNTSTNLSASFSNTNSQSKVKRSRKQQLTSVNREDSEIIIQPACMLQDEEDEEPTPKKRGRRKKKKSANEKLSKPTRKSKRRRSRVEIINIDVDEDFNDHSQRKEILEITLDDNKEKGSSDKENEVIMVGDSDDSDEDKAPKAISMKLRSKSRRLSSRRSSEEERPQNRSSKRNSKSKKQYPCKTCDKKFDMVVSLARHVRSEHSVRRRGRPSKLETQKNEKDKMQMRLEVTEVGNKKNQEKKTIETKPKEKSVSRREEESDEEETSEEKEEPKLPRAAKDSGIKAKMPTRKTKLITNVRRNWMSQELTCIYCNRWFPAASALEIHSLKHVTRKSGKEFTSNLKDPIPNKLLSNSNLTEKIEGVVFVPDKKVNRCPICKKLFKSQFLFMKHQRMHTKAKKNLETYRNETSKKTLFKEKATKKISGGRNRGRPRKLKSIHTSR